MGNISATEVDGFIRRLRWHMLIFVAMIVVPLLIYAFSLDRRMDSFEKTQRYRHPQENEDELPDDELKRVLAHPVKGQLVYIPAYSHVYHGAGKPHLLTITLSVRNTSIDHEIIVKYVRYYDTKGKEVKSYLKKPLRLSALATTEFLVEREDTSGGSGANFLVEWVASQAVSEPIIEAVMIDTRSQQGISFARSGKVIRELAPESTNDKASK